MKIVFKEDKKAVCHLQCLFLLILKAFLLKHSETITIPGKTLEYLVHVSSLNSVPFILQCKVLHSSDRTSGYSLWCSWCLCLSGTHRPLVCTTVVALPFLSLIIKMLPLPSKPHWGTNPLPCAELSNQHRLCPAQCTPQSGLPQHKQEQPVGVRSMSGSLWELCTPHILP